MNFVIPLKDITDKDRGLVGGKSFALARMHQSGMKIPAAVCITGDAYRHFIDQTGLSEKIFMELNRKDFNDMRWEEIWDASLRIRNMFVTTPIPEKLASTLKQSLTALFSDRTFVVRSSALEEDTAKASFAGLHESYVNVRELDATMKHIRLVWASLWSDAALLYRQELKLNVQKSAMAVVIQEIVNGEKSGVIFGRNPNNYTQSVLEAIYELNQGLVDGTVEPDRWILDGETGNILSHHQARRRSAFVSLSEGITLKPLEANKVHSPPLSPDEVSQVFRLVQQAEDLFGIPQDVEWTLRDKTLYVLQSAHKRLEDNEHPPSQNTSDKGREPGFKIQARQIVGQPSGPGIAQGRARVLTNFF